MLHRCLVAQSPVRPELRRLGGELVGSIGSLASWRHARGAISLEAPRLLGIINVTPDSFSDGGRLTSVSDAISHGERLVSEGADILDVGGESTRPQGAQPVTLEEELRRVIPVIRGLSSRLPNTPLSVDTTKSEVARAAIAAGASIVNDVSGLRFDPIMAEMCAASGAGVIVMHSRGAVRDMATYTHAVYGDDVVGEVLEELRERLTLAQSAGIPRDRIAVDPGIGFAKRSHHSLEVVAGLRRVAALGYPVLVGLSRKRFIGELSGQTVASQRDAATAGANCAALERGARLFRVHDVLLNRHALDTAWPIIAFNASSPK